MDKNLIYDTTLRDGEQMPGVVFSREEKIDLAKKMNEFGVNIIDIMPAVSKEEYETTSYLVDLNLKAEISASTMMRKDAIDMAYDCGVKRVCMFSPISKIQMNGMSEKENLERAVEHIDYACNKGLTVDFAGVDSTRANKKYLIDFVNVLGKRIDYFFACDSLGILTPIQTGNFISMLKNETDIKLGLHSHNDFGQAVANSLVGLEVGADIVSGTFGGIGERAGNASLEEIIMGLKEQYNTILPIKYEMIGEICEDVAKYSGIHLQHHKAISGKNAFIHESGVHVDAMLKNTKSYENFNPIVIGRVREFIAGKHSGTNILKYWFGDKFSNEEYKKILKQVKSWSREYKTAFHKNDILRLLNMEEMFDGI